MSFSGSVEAISAARSACRRRRRPGSSSRRRRRGSAVRIAPLALTITPVPSPSLSPLRRGAPRLDLDERRQDLLVHDRRGRRCRPLDPRSPSSTTSEAIVPTCARSSGVGESRVASTIPPATTPVTTTAASASRVRRPTPCSCQAVRRVRRSLPGGTPWSGAPEHPTGPLSPGRFRRRTRGRDGEE